MLVTIYTQPFQLFRMLTIVAVLTLTAGYLEIFWLYKTQSCLPPASQRIMIILWPMDHLPVQWLTGTPTLVNCGMMHLTHDNSVGSSYFFVDVHISAGTTNNLESASKSKLVQYNNAWNQFRQFDMRQY